MDCDALVNEEIEAAARFLAEFDKVRPIRVAFWLKATDETSWYLYIASDQIDNTKIGAAYRDVAHVAQTFRDPDFDVMRVKVVGIDDPFVHAALDILQRYPAKIPTRLRDRVFGRTHVAAVYVYPLPISVGSS